MDRSELALTGALILVVAGGACWNAHRVLSSGVDPVIVDDGGAAPPENPGVEAPLAPPGPAVPDFRAGGRVPARRKRDLNRATAAELAEVSGIGPALSGRIVEYRERNGPFREMRDLLEVPGIGASRLAALEELFQVSGRGESASPTPPPMRSRPQRTPAGGNADRRVDLNTASAAELERVPGIGPVLAERILRYRQEHGPFRRLLDLALVPGIGERRLEAFTPYLRISAPVDAGVYDPRAAPGNLPGAGLVPRRETDEADRIAPFSEEPRAPDFSGSEGGFDGGKIDINRATREELETLPGIGPVLADRIVAERRAGGAFRSPSDIQRVSGIGPKTFENLRDRIIAVP